MYKRKDTYKEEHLPIICLTQGIENVWGAHNSMIKKNKDLWVIKYLNEYLCKEIHNTYQTLEKINNSRSNYKSGYHNELSLPIMPLLILFWLDTR